MSLDWALTLGFATLCFGFGVGTAVGIYTCQHPRHSKPHTK